MRIKPAPGRQILDHKTFKPLLAVGIDGQEGEEKDIDSYWLRRLADGDVLEVAPAVPEPEPVTRKPRQKKGTDEGK